MYKIVNWVYHNTLKRFPKSLGHIFMLHRVDEFEKDHLWCNEHMKVTPAFLDSQIKLLKEEYDIISLKEVPARLKQKNKRKFVVFTMDDGYKDNYTKALTVLKSTMYLTQFLLLRIFLTVKQFSGGMNWRICFFQVTVLPFQME